MVWLEPDRGDVGHEAIGVERQVIGFEHAGMCREESGEALAIVDVQRTAVDAALLWTLSLSRWTCGASD